MADKDLSLKIKTDLGSSIKDLENLLSRVRDFSDDSVKAFEKLSSTTSTLLDQFKELSSISSNLSTAKVDVNLGSVSKSTSSNFLDKTTQTNKEEFKSSSGINDKNASDLNKTISQLSNEINKLSQQIAGGGAGGGGGGGKPPSPPPFSGGDDDDRFRKKGSKLIEDFVSGKAGGELGKLAGMFGNIFGLKGISGMAARVAGPLGVAQMVKETMDVLNSQFGETTTQNYEIQRRKIENKAFYEGQQGDFFRQMLRDTNSGLAERMIKRDAGILENFQDIVKSPLDLYDAFRMKTSFAEAREKRIRESSEHVGIEYSEDVRRALQKSFDRKINSFEAQLAIGVTGAESSYAALESAGLSNAEAARFVTDFARTRGRAASSEDALLAKSGLNYGFNDQLISSLIRSGGGRISGNQALFQAARVFSSAGVGAAALQEARQLVGSELSSLINASGGILSVSNIGETVSASAKTAAEYAEQQRGEVTVQEKTEATRQGIIGMNQFMQQSRDPRSYVSQTQMSVLMSMGLNPIEAMRAIQLGLNRADVVSGITKVAKSRTGKDFNPEFIKTEVSKRLTSAAKLEESFLGEDFRGIDLETKGFEEMSKMGGARARAVLAATAISTGKKSESTADELKGLMQSETTRNFLSENVSRYESEQRKAVESLPETLEQAITNSFDRGISELTKAIVNFINQTPEGQKIDREITIQKQRIETLQANAAEYTPQGRAQIEAHQREIDRLNRQKDERVGGKTPAKKFGGWQKFSGE